MPIYVMHEGRLIDKRDRPSKFECVASDLPAPAVQSFESFASPVDGQTISSRRQHDKDLHNSGSYDPRETPAAFRKAKDARREFAKRTAAEPARYR